MKNLYKLVVVRILLIFSILGCIAYTLKSLEIKERYCNNPKTCEKRDEKIRLPFRWPTIPNNSK